MDNLEVRPFSIPLRTRFRDLDVRTGLLIRHPGTARWGEFAPFADYRPFQSARWLAAALEASAGDWPEPVRDRVPVNVTVPAVSPAAAHELVLASGCSTAKVKVGDEGDEARVEAVRDALGSRGHLRIDVNARWDVETAARKLGELARYDLEYAEQPVATLEDMRALRRLVDVPLAADEVLRTAPVPEDVDLRDAADVAVVKVAPLGGVRRVLQLAERLPVPVVVSSALDSSVGLAAGVMCAACLPGPERACGLGTVTLMEGDVVTQPLAPVDGHVEVRVPEVDVARLGGIDPDELARLERQLREAREELGL